jgi:hypothetical protein
MEKLCHKTIELDFDDDGEPVIIGAPCIKERCMAWDGRCNLALDSIRVHGC